MKESQWVELVADQLRKEKIFGGNRFRIETHFKLAYGHEIRSFRENGAETKSIPFETDLVLIEDYPGGQWKPRVIIEAKLARVTTHDAITYSHKAISHKAVFPYLRYGIMIGYRQDAPLPGRLYRHGANFDFMVSFQDHDLNSKEKTEFLKILRSEIKASQTLERILFQSRKQDRDRYTVLHRKLNVKNVNA